MELNGLRTASGHVSGTVGHVTPVGKNENWAGSAGAYLACVHPFFMYLPQPATGRAAGIIHTRNFYYAIINRRQNKVTETTNQ